MSEHRESRKMSDSHISKKLGHGAADVIVVGSGAAGCVAAITAARQGCSVCLVESHESFGGTTAKSTGVVWVPNNPRLRESGVLEDRDAALLFMASAGYPKQFAAGAPKLGLDAITYNRLVAFYDQGCAVIEDLEEHTALRFITRLTRRGEWFPDYLADHPYNRTPAGRALVVRSRTDTRVKHLGGGGNGEELISQLVGHINALGIDTRLKTQVVGLLFAHEGAVVGVQVLGDGVPTKIQARKGVIFATGGYSENAEMRHRLAGTVFATFGAPSCQGDFLRITELAGARMAHAGRAYWSQYPFQASVGVPPQVFRSNSLPGDSMILVDRHGRRLMNEKAPYPQRGAFHSQPDLDDGTHSHLLAFMIYDSRTARLYAGHAPIPQSEQTPGYLLRGESLAELEREIRYRLADYADLTAGVTLAPDFLIRLQESIGEFNQFAATGLDRLYARGNARQDYAFFLKTDDELAQENPFPNKSMHPMSNCGPYFAVIHAGHILDTCEGPMTNAQGQVISSDGNVIPNLYAAGNCAASISPNTYFGGGMPIGIAMAFGRACGLHCADNPSFART